MTKRRALWVFGAVVAGLCLVVGGIIVGVSAWLVKSPPALFLDVGHYLYVGGLTDEERERIITERLLGIDTVQVVRIVKHDPHWTMEIEVQMADPDSDSALFWDVQHVCNEAGRLWNTFLDPVDVDCAALPLQQ